MRFRFAALAVLLSAVGCLLLASARPVQAQPDCRPPGAVPALPTDAQARPARFGAGAALTEGDAVLRADAARARFGVDGTGVRVAVISDGIVGLAQAQAAGEAPKLAAAYCFNGLGGGSLSRGDEGTAMIEIVHDLAPGAAISFGAVATDVDHQAAVRFFAQRVDIIVDDVSFPFPADQNSDVSRTTTAALQEPAWPLRLYVTAAGNWAQAHWGGRWQAAATAWRPPGAQGALQQFALEDGGGFDLRTVGNSVELQPGDDLRADLFWDDVWGAAVNDYDLYLVDEFGSVLASSQIRQGVGEAGKLPSEVITYSHEGEPLVGYLVIVNYLDEASPVRLDLFVYESGGRPLTLGLATAAGSLLAQSDAAGALTVGAAFVDRLAAAPYSSRGPTRNGAAKPELAATDGVTVSTHTSYAPRFGGSSAAAPHVAGIGALLLEAQPILLAHNGGSALLERELVRELLTETATDIPPNGVDAASGYGLVNAEAALLAAAERIRVPADLAELEQALSGGASHILCGEPLAGEAPTLRPLQPLPALQAGTVLDCAGWTLDASWLDVGLTVGAGAQVWGLAVAGANTAGVLVEGDGGRLRDVQVRDGGHGISVAGADAEIAGAVVSGNRLSGVSVLADASARISASTFQANAGPAVLIAADAGSVTIGPPQPPPSFTAPPSLDAAIAPFQSSPTEARRGLSHTLAGVLTVDGVPSGGLVEVYLDRRLTAAVLVDDAARFTLTVSGPGEELRFAVNGVPLSERLPFQAGATAQLTLNAPSRDQLQPAEPFSGGNVFRNNGVDVRIEAGDGIPSGGRLVWGNRLGAGGIGSPVPSPRIEEAVWSAGGLAVSGRAERSAMVHLYAGPVGDRRYVGAAAVQDGRFRFTNLHLDAAAVEFSVIAHDIFGVASEESAAVTTPPPGSVHSLDPPQGATSGGEAVEICGSLLGDADGPQIWFGARAASVTGWTNSCVSVVSPIGAAGLVDVTVLARGRVLTLPQAFEYRAVRVERLAGGWNAVRWHGADTRVTAAFASLTLPPGSRWHAAAFDAAQQTWHLFAPTAPAALNTLRRLRHQQLLWVFLGMADGSHAEWAQPLPAWLSDG